MKKLFALFALALCCMVAPASTTGCTPAQVQEVTNVANAVVTYIQDAQTILATIDTVVQIFFATHPNPTLQATYEADMGKCQAALTVAERATQGTSALTQSQIDTAFGDFKAAYTALTALLQSSGIMTAPNAMAAAPGQAPVQIQTPLIMLKGK